MTRSQPPKLSRTSSARYAVSLGLVSAAALIVTSFYLLVGGGPEPMPFKIALFLTGVVEGVACAKAARRSRAGWSVALALNGTLTVAFFFGSPRVRDGLGTSMAVGLGPCLVFLVTTVLLILAARDYRG